MKSEIRRPRSEPSSVAATNATKPPDAETIPTARMTSIPALGRVEKSPKSELRTRRPIRISAFGFLSAFGLRISDFALLSSLLFLLACFSGTAQEQPKPLLHAHAHNDYEHTRPLFDALDQGFCSVEADIFLVDGKLLVAHQRSQVKPERTLQALYLDPLRQRVKKNHGRVYLNGPECTLLIDLKTDWRQIYPVLREVLKEYSDILSTFRDGAKQTNALIAIITGNRSLQMFTGETTRYAAYDGELSELDSNEPANLIPWISSNWSATFKWRGAGEFPPDEKPRLKEILAKAHQHGRQVRFWGAPDKPIFWRELLDNGVDLINTDDLPGLRKFFDQRR